MRIQWANVIALLLFILAAVILIHGHESIGLFLSNLGNIGPRHSMEEQTLGLITFGIVGLCILAITKIVTRK